ncbi:phosphatase/phosphohexomutase [Tritrichomonas foetus]|uniref:Phosphatase/phosphohexomutase n=1 Tax=Tritrichomonas foetus TaxID=1144522 RepID=A0A1J4J6K3_9EUKA|nr:phosphatase/phosphohexomutase [Tritrichomonas foetus]|eukprot:OHS94297.1 phosphatase/phosphohexomutase [Tritrichomonas foetus]
MKPKFAVLFDNDGVVLNTEPQYDLFWNEQGKIFHPELPGFASYLKGFSLEKTLEVYFKDNEEDRITIVKRLYEFEDNMKFDYLPGAIELFQVLYEHNIPMALVTSSNDIKMEKILRVHPEFKKYFKAIVTSDKVTKTKPSPECYLFGARELGVDPSNCFVFEDSLAGIEAGKSAGCFVIGLATTNSREKIEPFADTVIKDLSEASYSFLIDLHQ